MPTWVEHWLVKKCDVEIPVNENKYNIVSWSNHVTHIRNQHPFFLSCTSKCSTCNEFLTVEIVSLNNLKNNWTCWWTRESNFFQTKSINLSLILIKMKYNGNHIFYHSQNQDVSRRYQLQYSNPDYLYFNTCISLGELGSITFSFFSLHLCFSICMLL